MPVDFILGVLLIALSTWRVSKLLVDVFDALGGFYSISSGS